MAKIVLAHGILGFGDVLPKQPLNYFNGIAALYTAQGHEVLCPTVPTLGSIAARSLKLQEQILAKWPTAGEPIYLLAHSMGGLDCRHLLASNAGIAARVKRLITITTPHYGSPVADAVLHPVFPGLPSPTQWLSGFFSANAGALTDLQTRVRLQDQSVGGVEYLCIGCNAAGAHPTSPIFALTAAIGEFGNDANDGVVSLSSASLTNNPSSLYEIWPVDHGGAIGWPTGGIAWQTAQAMGRAPPDHIARYMNLLPRLVE